MRSYILVREHYPFGLSCRATRIVNLRNVLVANWGVRERTVIGLFQFLLIIQINGAIRFPEPSRPQDSLNPSNLFSHLVYSILKG